MLKSKHEGRKKAQPGSQAGTSRSRRCELREGKLRDSTLKLPKVRHFLRLKHPDLSSYLPHPLGFLRNSARDESGGYRPGKASLQKLFTRSLRRSSGRLHSPPPAPSQECRSCSGKPRGMLGSPAPTSFSWDINRHSSPILGGRLNILSIPEKPASAPPP